MADAMDLNLEFDCATNGVPITKNINICLFLPGVIATLWLSCLENKFLTNTDAAKYYQRLIPFHRLIILSQEDNGFEFFNTIVLQPHLKLVTDLGRGYHVRCRYKNREAAAAAKTVPKTDDDTVESVTGDSITDNKEPSSSDRREYGRALGQKLRFVNDNEIPMPPAHMKIYSKETIAENVNIGDPLTMVISVDKQENYVLFVMSCLVRDGLGWSEQNLLKFG